MGRGTEKASAEVQNVCRDCVHADVVTEFHTLSIRGEPTLAYCPYHTAGRYAVLLSQPCCAHFRMRKTNH
jgi:hypothetical protein